MENRGAGHCYYVDQSINKVKENLPQSVLSHNNIYDRRYGSQQFKKSDIWSNLTVSLSPNTWVPRSNGSHSVY